MDGIARLVGYPIVSGRTLGALVITTASNAGVLIAAQSGFGFPVVAILANLGDLYCRALDTLPNRKVVYSPANWSRCPLTLGPRCTCVTGAPYREVNSKVATAPNT